MDKQRRLIVELIDQATHFAIFYGLFATALTFFSGGTTTFLQAGIIAVPFVIYYFLRRVSKRMWVLVALHMLWPAGIIIFSGRIHLAYGDGILMLFLITSLTLGIHSVACASRKEIRQFRFFVGTTALVFIILAIPITAYHHYHILPLYPVIILLVFFGRKFLLRIQNMATMLSVVHLSSKQPVKKIVSLDYGRTIVLVAVLLGMTILVHVFVVMPIFGEVVRLHHWLLEHGTTDERHYSWEGIDDWMEIGADEENIHDMVGEEMYEVDVTALFDFVYRILIIAAIASIPIFIFSVIFLFWDSITGLMTQIFNPKKKLLDDLDGEIEFLTETETRRKRSIFSRLWEHPTRRMYRKTARKYVKKGLPIAITDTPTEVAGHIVAEDISKLVEDYAKVRYREES